MAVTVQDVTQQVETSAPDEVITALIAANDAALTARYGDAATVTETIVTASSDTVGWPFRRPLESLTGHIGPRREHRFVTLSRAAGTINSVQEVYGAADTDAMHTLEPTDYRIISPYVVERLGRSWGQVVVITYALAVDSTPQRDQVVIRLVALDLAYSGYLRISSPEGMTIALDYTAERTKLIESLSAPGRLFV